MFYITFVIFISSERRFHLPRCIFQSDSVVMDLAMKDSDQVYSHLEPLEASRIRFSGGPAFQQARLIFSLMGSDWMIARHCHITTFQMVRVDIEINKYPRIKDVQKERFETEIHDTNFYCREYWPKMITSIVYLNQVYNFQKLNDFRK